MSKVLTKEIISAIDKLNAIESEVSKYVLEKEEVLKLIKFALIGRRNLFFLGKTGQAKSYVITEFTKRITNNIYFEILMNKMIDKDEIFGRLNIPELVKGIQKIITKGKVGESNINFFDEIFKSNSIVINSLLKLLNFEDINLEGNVISPPTICSFLASNEIPNFKDDEGKTLYPIYNRLHLKIVTKYIEEKDNFKVAAKMKRLRDKSVIENTISLEEIRLLNQVVSKINVPDEIDDLMWEISNQIKIKLDREVSDRKLIEYSVLVQTSALLDKRDTVVPNDMKVLLYYLWETPEEIETISNIINELTENPFKEKIEQIKAMATEQIQEGIKLADNDNIRAKNKAFTKAEKELFQLHSMLQEIKTEIKINEDEICVRETFDYLNDLYRKLNEKFEYTYIPIEQMKERQGL